jgi:hypothetical protein
MNIFPSKRHCPKGLCRCIPPTLLAALAVMLLNLTAGSAAAKGDHACDYLSKDEVARVMGVAVGEVNRLAANPMGESVCFFDIPAGMKLRYAQLQMVRSAWATRAGSNWNARSLFENNMIFLSDLKEINGIGEKAYWAGSGMKMGAGLHVLHEDTSFTVDVASGDEQNDLEKAKELAALVLANIE